jgi:hypothetical protein
MDFWANIGWMEHAIGKLLSRLKNMPMVKASSRPSHRIFTPILPTMTFTTRISTIFNCSLERAFKTPSFIP